MKAVGTMVPLFKDFTAFSNSSLIKIDLVPKFVNVQRRSRYLVVTGAINY